MAPDLTADLRAMRRAALRWHEVESKLHEVKNDAANLHASTDYKFFKEFLKKYNDVSEKFSGCVNSGAIAADNMGTTLISVANRFEAQDSPPG